MMAMIMIMTLNSTIRVKTVVKEPSPATSGKAIGTMEADSGFDVLLISMPKIISTAMMKITNAPATSKDSTSIPIKLKIFVPKNKKDIMMIVATMVAFSEIGRAHV